MKVTALTIITTITVTSYWARWGLKSPASRLFTHPFIQVQIKENIHVPCHWPLWGEITVRGNHRSPVNSPHKGPVTRKLFPFDYVIMNGNHHCLCLHPIAPAMMTVIVLLFIPVATTSFNPWCPGLDGNNGGYCSPLDIVQWNLSTTTT